MSTIQDDILDRIRGHDRGKVFTPKDFLDLGSRDAADQSLSRLVRSGEIQRLGRGIYHYPRVNERLGIPIGPDPDEIAEAAGPSDGHPGASLPATASGQPAWAIDPGAGQAGLPDRRADPPSADRWHGVPDQARSPKGVVCGEPDQRDGVPGTAASRANGCRRSSDRAPATRALGGSTAAASPGFAVHDRLDRGLTSSAKSRKTRRSW